MLSGGFCLPSGVFTLERLNFSNRSEMKLRKKIVFSYHNESLIFGHALTYVLFFKKWLIGGE